ncbi:MAG: SGNH/GDSL hydrolase family protein [Lentisphaerae bacterium]|nr:SGNH/GDSL hydrolase family protein [Lentisphaerota bacterium]
MKTIATDVSAAAVSPAASAAAAPTGSPRRVVREDIEWCDVWISKADQNSIPHVLLVGDSITKSYHGAVAKQLEATASCARLTTSACVCDPVFQLQLEAVLTGWQFAVIHFNNGLHGMGYLESEYRLGYEQALKVIRKLQPGAKLILVLSTPLQPTSAPNNLNPRVDARNKIVKELAEQFGAPINDLHSISKNHPEHYADACHFGSAAKGLQAGQVVNQITALINGKPGVGGDGQPAR